MDSWVLIPCHNNSALLQSALESILAQTIPVRIFAINNGSKDNVPFVLETLDHNHIVTHHTPQLGVAGAWNAGLSLLFSGAFGRTDRVLVVNQDVILRSDTYEELDRDNGTFNTAVSTNDRKELWVERSSDVRSRRPHPDFSCFRITRDCYERVGPFDEGFYPAWFEDNDYHIRSAKAGIELYCIDLPFFHYAAGTMKTASEYDRSHYYDVGFRASRERFQKRYGCLPGTKEYENKCDPNYWITNEGNGTGN